MAEKSKVVRKINLTSAELEMLRRFVGRFDPDADEQEKDQIVAVEIVESDQLQELARRIFNDRSRRERYFPPCMFGEPAWEMLLALYTHSAEGKRLSVTQLTSFASSSATTGLRWLDYLADEELILRLPHPRDGRVHHIELSEKARSAMDRCLAEMLKSSR